MYRLLVGVTVIPGEQPVFIFRGSSPLSCTSTALGMLTTDSPAAFLLSAGCDNATEKSKREAQNPVRTQGAACRDKWFLSHSAASQRAPAGTTCHLAQEHHQITQ